MITAVRKGQIINGSEVTDFEFQSVQGGRHRNFNRHGQIVYTVQLNGSGSVGGLFTFTPDLHWRRSIGGDWETSDNWTLGLTPDQPHDVFIDGDVDLTITGPASDTTIHGLQVGGGSGDATLQLVSGTVLTATSGISVRSNGTIIGDGSTLDLVGGVTSDGLIESEILNLTGELANQATGLINMQSGTLATLPGSVNHGRIEFTTGVSNVVGDLANSAMINVERRLKLHSMGGHYKSMVRSTFIRLH